MVAGSDGIDAAYGGRVNGSGDDHEAVLQRAGTVAQRRHTRKATQMAMVASYTDLLPETPPMIPFSAELNFDGAVVSTRSSPSDSKESPLSSTAADDLSLTTQTVSSFEMDRYGIDTAPEPHLPLRKSSASNLREKISSKDMIFAEREDTSPTLSQFPERRSSRINSPRLRRDRQEPTLVARDNTSPQDNVHAFVAPPRGRQRGMTTAGARPLGEFASQFRSPSIPDLRGTARAQVSSTYKPERGPNSREPALAFKSPPMPWKETDEVRASFRSALTNASYATYTSSGYYEASETERSSVVTRSSSISNYSRRQGGSEYGDDDFDVGDYIDLYVGGFRDDSPRPGSKRSHSQPKQELEVEEAGPPVPGKSPTFPPPNMRRLSAQISLRGKPSPIPTKYDSKFDDDLALPTSPGIPRSAPNSPLLSHPVNPASPPSPTSLLKGAEISPLQGPISPQSPLETSPLATTPLDTPMGTSTSNPFFSAPQRTTTQQTQSERGSRKTSVSEDAGPVPRDRYGFKKATAYITAKQYDAWNAEYSGHLERRQAKWEVMMIQHGLPIHDPLRFPPRSDKVKRYIRKGIPPDWRGAAWFWYANGPQLLAQNPGLYERLVREADSGSPKLNDIDREIIERDLHRTFPDNIQFKPDQDPVEGRDAEAHIIQSLRRLLQAFAIHNPNIGYCQSLNFLAGMLLLFLKNEEKAFHLLNVICNVHLPGTHAKVLEANVDIGVLMSCIRDSMPQVWAKIDDTDGGPRGVISTSRLPTVSLATTSWFMSCFIGNLPTEAVLRVWDCFFYEGSKTLFRIALAIFKAGENEIRNVSQEMEVFQVVQLIPRRMLDVNALMQSCYKKRNGFGHLSQDVIDARRRERRTALQQERERKNQGPTASGALQSPTSPFAAGEERPQSRGRKGTLSRAASRARGLNRAKSRRREVPNEPVPVTPAIPT